MTEKERMLSGQLYLSRDPQLKKERFRNQRRLNRFNRLLPADKNKRTTLIHRIFSQAGKACSVYPPFYCDYGYNIKVGDYFFANRNCTILDVAHVYIGNHVMLGPNVMILTASHPLDSAQRANGYGCGCSVHIGDYVWIGAGAIINPGVRIGSHSVVGAGSVVTHDIPAHTLAAGNPCQVIRLIKTADS